MAGRRLISIPGLEPCDLQASIPGRVVVIEGEEKEQEQAMPSRETIQRLRRIPYEETIAEGEAFMRTDITDSEDEGNGEGDLDIHLGEADSKVGDEIDV